MARECEICGVERESQDSKNWYVLRIGAGCHISCLAEHYKMREKNQAQQPSPTLAEKGTICPECGCRFKPNSQTILNGEAQTLAELLTAAEAGRILQEVCDADALDCYDNPECMERGTAHKFCAELEKLRKEAASEQSHRPNSGSAAATADADN